MYRTIIVTDDSATARLMVKRCLEIAGCEGATFYEACDGKEALQLAKEHQADLLVTDLNMPEMDGISLLKRVKASPRLTDLPVLVISSLSNAAREIELLELGAFAVLSKPVTPTNLVDILQKQTDADETQWG